MYSSFSIVKHCFALGKPGVSQHEQIEMFDHIQVFLVTILKYSMSFPGYIDALSLYIVCETVL